MLKKFIIKSWLEVVEQLLNLFSGKNYAKNGVFLIFFLFLVFWRWDLRWEVIAWFPRPFYGTNSSYGNNGFRKHALKQVGRRPFYPHFFRTTIHRCKVQQTHPHLKRCLAAYLLTIPRTNTLPHDTGREPNAWFVAFLSDFVNVPKPLPKFKKIADTPYWGILLRPYSH